MTLIMQVQFLNLVGKIGGDEKDEDFGAFTEGFGCVRERESVGCLSVCLSVCADQLTLSAPPPTSLS